MRKKAAQSFFHSTIIKVKKHSIITKICIQVTVSLNLQLIFSDILSFIDFFKVSFITSECALNEGGH
jgi:hypothetical protein